MINSSVYRKDRTIESWVGMKESNWELLGEALVKLTGCLARFWVLWSCPLIQEWDLPVDRHERFPMFLWQVEVGGSSSFSSVCTVGKESSVWKKEFNRSRKSVPSALELTQCCSWHMVVPQQVFACWTKRRNEGTHKPCWWNEGKWMGHRAGPMATWAWITDFSFLENYGLW